MNSEKKYLEIEELKPCYLYKIKARNAEIGIWNKNKKSFLIPRFKFTNWYVFEEYHWDTGEPYGTAKPLKELEETNFVDEDLELKLFKDNCGLYRDYEPKVFDYLMEKKEQYKEK